MLNISLAKMMVVGRRLREGLVLYFDGWMDEGTRDERDLSSILVVSSFN